MGRHEEENEKQRDEERKREQDTPRVPRTPAQPPKPETPQEGSTLVRALTAGAAAAVLLFAGTFAHARDNYDCSILGDHTPFVCVHNSMTRSIGEISCTGFWGTTYMSVPGGAIPAGHMAVIKFDAGKCKKQIDIRTKDGHEQTVRGFDFDKNFELEVNDQ